MEPNTKTSPGMVHFVLARFGEIEVVLSPELHRDPLQHREVFSTPAQQVAR